MDFKNDTDIGNIEENKNAVCIYCNSLYSHLKSNEQ